MRNESNQVININDIIIIIINDMLHCQTISVIKDDWWKSHTRLKR